MLKSTTHFSYHKTSTVWSNLCFVVETTIETTVGKGKMLLYNLLNTNAKLTSGCINEASNEANNCRFAVGRRTRMTVKEAD